VWQTNQARRQSGAVRKVGNVKGTEKQLSRKGLTDMHTSYQIDEMYNAPTA